MLVSLIWRERIPLSFSLPFSIAFSFPFALPFAIPFPFPLSLPFSLPSFTRANRMRRRMRRSRRPLITLIPRWRTALTLRLRMMQQQAPGARRQPIPSHSSARNTPTRTTHTPQHTCTPQLMWPVHVHWRQRGMLLHPSRPRIVQDNRRWRSTAERPRGRYTCARGTTTCLSVHARTRDARCSSRVRWAREDRAPSGTCEEERGGRAGGTWSAWRCTVPGAT